MRYDTNKTWEDPYRESLESRTKTNDDRRDSPRVDARYRLHIAVHRGTGEKPLVAQGEVLNVSMSGMYLRSKQVLEVGQLVDLAIPTKDCPQDFALPKAFLGKARVARIDSRDGDVSVAALAVDRELLDDMSYAVFIEFQRRKAMSKS
jgi:hypothetical protein